MTHSRRTAIRYRYVVGMVVLSLSAAAGCDIPTDLPDIESRWIVPAEETRFSVEELLPGDVTLSPDSSTFVVDFDPVAFSNSLGDLCAACLAADGLTVPKPPFAGTVESGVDFPPEVYAVGIVSGQVALEIENLLGFDPLRPAAGSDGTMTVRVTDSADGDLLSELVVDGASTALPSGSTLMLDLTLAATEVNGGLLATVVIDSPLGDAVTIDASALVNVVATPSSVLVSDVDIDVSNETVTFDPVDLGLDEVDPEIQEIIVEGAFVLTVVNPFGIEADFDLTIDGPSITAIVRSATITTAPESTVVIAFTGEEIQSFIGKPNVLLTGGATVSATAGIVTVRPGEELVLTADLDLTLRLTGVGD